MSVAAILLAASRAELDGVPIALLPCGDGDTMIEREVTDLLAAGIDSVEVVLGYEADRVVPLLSTVNVEPIVHGAWAHDEAGALRTGAAATPRGVAAAIVADIARPRPAVVYERLLDAHFSSVAAISRPSHGGEPGWPVIVDEHVLAELRNVSDATGGIEVLLARHAAEAQDVPFDDPVVVLEIDSRDTYERALEALR